MMMAKAGFHINQRSFEPLHIVTGRQIQGNESNSTRGYKDVSLHQKPRYAIVRRVPNTFSQCITMEKLSKGIDLRLARQQHSEYIRVLKELVDEVIELPMDDAYPDCPFVEDTAVVSGSTALVTRPGAASRRGEVEVVRETLKFLGLKVFEVCSPGLLDGGDVLHVDGMLLVGKSRRTNDEGVQALASAFPEMQVVPVEVSEGLHLKSVLSFVGQHTLVVEETHNAQEMVRIIQQACMLESIMVSIPGAANVLRVGNTIVYPSFYGRDWESQYMLFAEKVIPVDISEFHKGDGGLTCLSIIIP
ncbi:hypothetical protein O6H91_11G050100 [Diphasiastrum complanatum]|uniref:Uncharacterized protein n=1 Tax=Diphasiastrum complanatum TaxID=34168 RepID=A0ACC2C8Z8_DIPCM|nr:hypothetical protein O6H91_11G050100 [Diphasiastrum complanatum]